MKRSAVARAFRIVGLLVLMLAISLIIVFTMLPIMAEPANVRINADSRTLARGDYLFNSVLGCPVCHSERDWTKVGAPPMPPLGGGRDCDYTGETQVGLSMGSGFPGTICFRNITPDRETGIGDWSDGEIIRAIREGISKRGNALFPTMPYAIYSGISDQDVRAVVAYLRTLEPVSRPLPDTKIDFPISLAINFAPRPVSGEVRHPDATDSVATGEYLLRVARCKFCHSPRNSRNRQPYPGQEFSGGVEFQGREGLFYSTNLTPHEDGIAGISRAEFIALFRSKTGMRTGEVNIMPWTYFATMADEDLGAMYDYLQTVPPKPTGGEADAI